MLVRRSIVKAKIPDPNSFLEAISKIKVTPPGKEASMYGPIRDIFVDTLGYKRPDVDIDTTAEGGRPDVTVRAESGLQRAGKPYLINWIVVEAKDEKNAFGDPLERERIYAAKLKYVTINTAWFVMVEPTMFVARPVQRSLNSASGIITTYADIEFKLDGSETEAAFKASFNMLHAMYAGVPERLSRFREGDVSLIATDRLELRTGDTQKEASAVTLNRRNFFGAVSDATSLLQSACNTVLDTLAPRITAFQILRNEFSERFHGCRIQWKPLIIRGDPRSLEESKDHIAAVALFRRAIQRDPIAARLALVSLPEFIERTGSKPEYVMDRFGTETANLILARILVVRFLEDHGFFGAHKYVCNGGVEAFQKMHSYFEKGYTRLLEDAFRSAKTLYSAAFDETELDWIIGMDDRGLSNAIEWAMYLFSRFDFATIRGDALTGVYDRFLDRKKRKQFGEFYTPPAVARYIVQRLNITGASKVLDPACGSGTFLIEAFEVMVAEDARRGAADGPDILRALGNINGNDLNSFSAVLAQIQMMWQLLPFKSDILQDGFPEIRVSDEDALKRNGLDAPLSLFSEIEGDSYDAVIGNPPYIRPERLKAELSRLSREYFQSGRISPDQNSYALFVYKALDTWCKRTDDEIGRIGFIVPLALFDSDASADLRELFAPGQRFAIEEIVDLEMVYNHIFDAWTYPMILIARASAASPSDDVTIRLADPSCVKMAPDGSTAIDFALIPTHSVRYEDLFAPDGRIYTRMTPSRSTIIRKLQSQSKIEDIVLRFWTQSQKNRIVQWSLSAPAKQQAHKWEEKRMLRYGLEERKSTPAAGGTFPLDVYKGENIVSTEIIGSAAYNSVDSSTFDNASVWRYLGDAAAVGQPNILGSKAFAIPRITQCVNAAPFDPQKVAFLNTATVFIPERALQAFPFDLLFLSNVCVYYLPLAARMGIIRAQNSTIYPSCVGQMPWADELGAKSAEIEGLRNRIVATSHAFVQTSVSLDDALRSLGLQSVKAIVKANKEAHLQFSSVFDDADYEAEVRLPSLVPSQDGWTVFFNDTLLDSLDVSDEAIALGIVKALDRKAGELLTKGKFLNLSIPLGAKEQANWDSILKAHDVSTVEAALQNVIRELDAIVGPCFGLTDADLDEIREDLKTDPFLSKIRPIYPGSQRRLQGLLQGLDSSERYS